MDYFQAYLAFYVINDLQMAQSAKALVHNKFCPFLNSFHFLYDYIQSEVRTTMTPIILFHDDWIGSCYHIHQLFHCIYRITGSLIKTLSLIDRYFSSIHFYVVNFRHYICLLFCRRLLGLANFSRLTSLQDAFFGFCVVQWSCF